MFEINDRSLLVMEKLFGKNVFLWWLLWGGNFFFLLHWMVKVTETVRSGLGYLKENFISKFLIIVERQFDEFKFI